MLAALGDQYMREMMEVRRRAATLQRCDSKRWKQTNSKEFISVQRRGRAAAAAAAAWAVLPGKGNRGWRLQLKVRSACVLCGCA